MRNAANNAITACRVHERRLNTLRLPGRAAGHVTYQRGRGAVNATNRSLSGMVKSADMALLQSKNAGRNRAKWRHDVSRASEVSASDFSATLRHRFYYRCAEAAFFRRVRLQSSFRRARAHHISLSSPDAFRFRVPFRRSITACAANL